MRTLYVRIIVTTILIMIGSAVIAFVVSNGYYQYVLKPQNDEKVTHIAKNIVDLYNSSEQSIDDYLTEVTDLGYSFYLVHNNGDTQAFGKSFESKDLPSNVIKDVLAGEVYHGIANYPWRLFITGFFDHTLSNTIGVPINENQQNYALFVRPYASQQFGEMRVFFAIIIGLILILSFLFVLISTRWIVKPIQILKEATNKVAAGNYHLQLPVTRKDEFGQLAKDFATMSKSLQQTEQRRQAFVSNVSHEIQSPLTSIQGFSQALQEANLTKDERDHYLAIIEKESKRLSILSRQLLTLSQLDREDEKIERTPFELEEQLRDVLSTLEWQWRQKELTVEWKVQKTIINGDPRLLHQVWMNVMTNAIRYTPEEGAITIAVEKTKSEVEVTVTDTGIGIAAEDLSQIFDRFYKVDKARTRKESGTGLGLSITKKIVEIHQGTIIVDSKLASGTTVTITLPQ
ncbi:HAMP domain-containing sensor histidine kinase [Virgibacillus salexigens]|uniref:HAMP domain-containing sensor histidine kinase n=1 Tax=Virgibacillus salexigens TaxID=61016 RepID=UPI00190CC9B2|nr:HAMP domain-containing sensor histidine kinase [Virgibacillus salexigens]